VEGRDEDWNALCVNCGLFANAGDPVPEPAADPPIGERVWYPGGAPLERCPGLNVDPENPDVALDPRLMLPMAPQAGGGSLLKLRFIKSSIKLPIRRQ
jgi:hypothetical protein